jgi:hypothetical protein
MSTPRYPPRRRYADRLARVLALLDLAGDAIDELLALDGDGFVERLKGEQPGAPRRGDALHSREADCKFVRDAIDGIGWQLGLVMSGVEDGAPFDVQRRARELAERLRAEADAPTIPTTSEA